MEYNRDFFIFGEPIETKFGKVRFLTYKEFLTYQSYLSSISMNSLHIFYYYKKIIKNATDEDLKVLEELKNTNLYEIVLSTPQFLQVYVDIFNMLTTFNDGFELAHLFENQDDFMEMRQLIMDMNVITEEEVNPNEEIQSYIDASRELKQQESEKQSHTDIISTIVVGVGVDYDTVLNWNVIRVYSALLRISAFKNSEITALFATVSDKVKLETWQKHIDLFEKEKTGMKMSEFNKKYGNLF